MGLRFKEAALLFAMLTATAATPVFPVHAVEPAATTLPAWVPEYFGETVDFIRQHGRSYAADGIVCTVQVRQKGDYVYEETVSDSKRRNQDWTLSYSGLEDFESRSPQEQKDTIENLHNKTSKNEKTYGEDRHVYVDADEAACMSDYILFVSIYKAAEAGSFTVTQKCTQGGKVLDNTTLSFTVGSDGKITETDPYGWIPDCEDEYEAFLAKNGAASAVNGHIVYLGEQWENAGFSVQTEHSGQAERVLRSEIMRLPSKRHIGGVAPIVEVWKPTGGGALDFTWKYQNDRSGEVCGTVQAKFDTQGRLGDQNITGDVNGDRVLSCKDLFPALNAFLVSGGTISASADFNGDKTINAVDKSLLKRQMLPYYRP